MISLFLYIKIGLSCASFPIESIPSFLFTATFKSPSNRKYAFHARPQVYFHLSFFKFGFHYRPMHSLNLLQHERIPFTSTSTTPINLPPRQLPLPLLHLHNLPINQFRLRTPFHRHKIINPSHHHPRTHSPNPSHQT